MRKFLKYSAIALCITLLIATVVAVIAVNDKAEAATYTKKTGEWVTENKFNFNGKECTVTENDEAEGTYLHQSISVGSTTYYLVDTQEELLSLVNNTSSSNKPNIIIAANFNVTGLKTASGTTYANIEGCSHTITFDATCTVGLFHNLYGNVSDLTFAGTASPNGHFGLLCSWYKGGTLTSITNNANFVCDLTPANGAHFGAIVGNVGAKADFYNCHNTGNITQKEGSTDTKGRMAGIACSTNQGISVTFTDCTNSGNMTHENGSNQAAGIVALVKGPLTMTRCTNSGDITYKGRACGMIGVFEQQKVDGAVQDYVLKLEDCTNTGDMTSLGNNAAGMIGITQNKGTKEFINCKNSGTIIGESNVGGLIGQMSSDASTYIKFTGCENSGNVKNGKKTGVSEGGFIGECTANAPYTFTNCTVSGEVGNNLANNHGGFIGKFNVANTIEFSGCTSNVTMNLDKVQKAGGFIGVIHNNTKPTFNNGCTFGGTIISKGDACGYIGNPGNAKVIVDGCSTASTALIKTTTGSNCGGFFGYCGNGEIQISNSENNATVISGGAGGFIGKSDGKFTIDNCTNKGHITTRSGGDGAAGGIVGAVRNGNGTFSITNCVNEGIVEGTAYNSYAAGILGAYNRLNCVIVIDGCENKGTVKLTNEATTYAAAAGIFAGVGSYNNYYHDANNGTYTDQNPTITITNCINSGTLINEGATGTAFSDLAGILARTGKAGTTVAVQDDPETEENEEVKLTTNFNITISNCANVGRIIDAYTGANGTDSGNNASNAAGIVARHELCTESAETSSLVIENCYSAGTYSLVSSDKFNSAITRAVGKAKDEYVTVTNCYYVNEANNTFEDASQVSALQVSNGYLAYNLTQGGGEWYQAIDNGKTPDAYPVLKASQGAVYATELMLGTTSLGNTFSNTQGETLQIQFNTKTVGLRIGETVALSGLRWTVEINEAHLNLLKNTFGNDLKIGTMIVNSVIYDIADEEGIDMTMEAFKAAFETDELYLNVVANATDLYGAGTWAGSVVNIKESNFASKFYGVGYIQVGETTVYAEDILTTDETFDELVVNAYDELSASDAEIPAALEELYGMI